MKISPLGDRLALKFYEKEESTKAGIILVASSQERPKYLEVVAAGPEATIQVGQKVIYPKHAGTSIKFGEEEYIIVRQSDILAIVEEQPTE